MTTQGMLVLAALVLPGVVAQSRGNGFAPDDSRRKHCCGDYNPGRSSGRLKGFPVWDAFCFC
jgi:hypothetical protein